MKNQDWQLPSEMISNFSMESKQRYQILILKSHKVIKQLHKLPQFPLWNQLEINQQAYKNEMKNMKEVHIEQKQQK